MVWPALAIERLAHMRLGRRGGQTMPHKPLAMLAVLGWAAANFARLEAGVTWAELEPRLEQLRSALTPLAPRPSEAIKPLYALESDLGLRVLSADPALTPEQWFSMRLRRVACKQVQVHLVDWVREALGGVDAVYAAAIRVVNDQRALLCAFRSDEATTEELVQVWLTCSGLSQPTAEARDLVQTMQQHAAIAAAA